MFYYIPKNQINNPLSSVFNVNILFYFNLLYFSMLILHVCNVCKLYSTHYSFLICHIIIINVYFLILRCFIMYCTVYTAFVVSNVHIEIVILLSDLKLSLLKISFWPFWSLALHSWYSWHYCWSHGPQPCLISS